MADLANLRKKIQLRHRKEQDTVQCFSTPKEYELNSIKNFVTQGIELWQKKEEKILELKIQ